MQSNSSTQPTTIDKIIVLSAITGICLALLASFGTFDMPNDPDNAAMMHTAWNEAGPVPNRAAKGDRLDYIGQLASR